MFSLTHTDCHPSPITSSGTHSESRPNGDIGQLEQWQTYGPAKMVPAQRELCYFSLCNCRYPRYALSLTYYTGCMAGTCLCKPELAVASAECHTRVPQRREGSSLVEGSGGEHVCFGVRLFGVGTGCVRGQPCGTHRLSNPIIPALI